MANLSNINNKFLVTTGGNVLIGQTSVVGSSILQVTGNSTLAGNVSISVNSATSDTLQINNGSVRTHLLGSESSNGVIYMRSSANSNTIRINASGDSYFNGGNVGIGNTSPSSSTSNANKLVVGDGTVSQGITILTADNTSGNLYFADGITGNEGYRGIIRYNHDSDRFQIYTSATQRMVILGNGNVGIGTTSPDSKLHVESTGATGANFILETTHSGGIPLLDLKGAASAQLRYKDELNVIQSRIDFGDSGTFNFIDVPNNNSTLYLKTGGNVGIGTTSPDTLLNLEGVKNTSIITLGSTTNDSNWSTGDKYGAINFYSADASGAGAGVKSSISYEVTAAASGATNHLSFRTAGTTAGTNNTERMRITSSAEGHVELLGTAPLIKATASNGGSGLRINIAGQTSGQLFRVQEDGTTKFQINENGNVGIGTTSPVYKLQVEDSAADIFFGATDATTGSMFRLRSNNKAVTIVDIDASGASSFAGNITISKATPFITLSNTAEDECGIVMLDSADAGQSAKITYDASGNTLKFYNNAASERMRISSAGEIRTYYSSVFGKVQRYTGSTATVYPQVFEYGGATRGSISMNNSGVSYNTTSDYRLKENVVEMTGALDRISQLKPSRFNFVTDSSATVDGFLAHEVQEIVPEAITGIKDGVDEKGNPEYQGIDQSKLVPLLVAAVQELKAEIELLKSK